ncbi:MAG TPA: MFS transporter [Candidatus Limnocylindrales bacterium]|nr:MFS transporter [Candidatus Limnocylindrales bacterium]
MAAPAGVGRERAVAALDPRFAATAVALFLASLSLRPQLVGAAPLVPEIQADLGISHLVAGLLGTIPVLCMGLFAPVAPLVAARLGTSLAVAASVALIGVAGLLRSAAWDAASLVAATIAIGVGMGVAGALMPVVVKERLASRPLGATVAYSAGLQLGSAASAALAVPVAAALGGWRMSLVVFSAATLLVLAPWGRLLGGRAHSRPRLAVSGIGFRDRQALALGAVFALFGVVYYGLIAWLPDSLVEHGSTAATGGAVVGLLNLASLVGVLTVGGFAGRIASTAVSGTILASGLAVAAIGFVLLPGAAPAWAVLAGYTNGALFPLLLALPPRVASDPPAVARLSSTMLGIGYTLAAVSPAGLGAVRDATGGFSVSLSLVAVAAVAFALALALVLQRGEGRTGPMSAEPVGSRSSSKHRPTRAQRRGARGNPGSASGRPRPPVR